MIEPIGSGRPCRAQPSASVSNPQRWRSPCTSKPLFADRRPTRPTAEKTRPDGYRLGDWRPLLLQAATVDVPNGPCPPSRTYLRRARLHATDAPGHLGSEATMWGSTPIDQLNCRVQFKGLHYQGAYTPPRWTGTSRVRPGTNDELGRPVDRQAARHHDRQRHANHDEEAPAQL